MFKINVLEHRNVKLGKIAVDIVQHLHVSFNQVTRFVGREFSIMKQIVERTTMNTIWHQATSFFIGVNSHSGCHIDDEMYHTLALVIAPKDVSAEK